MEITRIEADLCRSILGYLIQNLVKTTEYFQNDSPLVFKTFLKLEVSFLWGKEVRDLCFLRFLSP